MKRKTAWLAGMAILLAAAAPAAAAEARWNLWNDPQGDITKAGEAKPAPAPKPTPTPLRSSAPAGKAKTDARQDYVIGAGDVLDISVWQDVSLSKTVVVRPDGKVSFPLIGELDAAGNTVVRLKEELAQKLSRYVTDLVLSVEVKQINSMVIYVIGRVNSPGRFAVTSNVNVLQALSMAGGFNPFASKDRVSIFRQNGDGTEVMPFRYSDVAEGKNLDANIVLQRGDVIVVP
jgi:polysaccharide export outer membrane protein